FSENHLRAVLEALLGTELDELLPEDLRMPGNVVDVLLGIRRRDLTAELLQALDDPDRCIAMPRVVRGGEPHGAGAENRDVNQAVSVHGRKCSPLLCAAAGTAAGVGRRSLAFSAFFDLKRV